MTGGGPYRFFLHDYYGHDTAYHLQLERLSNPVGCAPLALAQFGDPGAAKAAGALKADQVRCHLVTAAAGRHVIRLHTLAGETRWQIYDAAGGEFCTEPGNYGICDLPEAGRYSVHVVNKGWNDARYELAVMPLVGNEGCAASTGTAWTLPTITVRPAAFAQVNCQPFTANAGERIAVYRTESYAWYVQSWITDDTGTQICPQWNEGLGCALPAGGPYRLMSYLTVTDVTEEPPSYGVQIRNASTPVGCPVVKPGVYGAEPAGPLGGIRCRSLVVPAAGRYTVEALDDTNSSVYGIVYDADGKELCQTVCAFTEPGTYLLVIDRSSQINDTEYVTAFLPHTGAGCVQTSDRGLTLDPVQGSLRTAGQYNCLELPSPAGSHITFLLPQDAAATAIPDVRVVDATGEWLCDLYALEENNCELTGTAPFRIVLSGRDDHVTRDYRAVITRTDGLTGCGAFPQGKFGADTGAAVALTAKRYATCRTINANQHAAAELVALRRTTGTGAARVSVYGAEGQRACGTGKGQFRYMSCSLDSTGSYTAIVNGSAATATYQLTRRDLTSTAAGCQPVSSLAMGGASASGTIGSISDFRCHQVTAGAGDRIWLDTRDAANATRYFVTGPAGQATSCAFYFQPCQVSGSTKYQLIVLPPAAVTAPLNYRVDAWRLNAGSEPPPGCTVVPDVSQGFGPFTGVLSDAKPGSCLTMTVAYWNRFRVQLTNTEGGAPLPRPYLVTSRGLRVCDGVGVGSYSCAPYLDGQTEKILLVLGSGDAVGRLPYKIVATCEEPRCGGTAGTRAKRSR